MLGEDGFFEGKVNYGSQSTRLKYQGHHTVIGPVCVLCQSAIFHRFVSLLEVRSIWDPFINPKVLLLAGAGLSAVWGWRAKERSAVETDRAVCVCLCVQQGVVACSHAHALRPSI